MRKAVVAALMMLLLVPKLKAGDEKFQVTLLLSPSLEWVHFSQSFLAGTYNNLWGSKLSYNFGIEYKRFFDPSLSLSTGILYMNKGFRNQVSETLNDGSVVTGITLMSAHMAAVPLYINVHHRLARKVEMIYTAGLAGGYIFRESVRNKNYTGELDPNQSIWDVSNPSATVNLFNDYFVGLHLGVGVSAYLKSRIVMIVQPMYKWQIHDARDYLGQFNSGDPFVTRLNSFGVDLKVGYFFTKQIRNRKKEY